MSFYQFLGRLIFLPALLSLGLFLGCEPQPPVTEKDANTKQVTVAITGMT